ncbi:MULTISPECIES: acetylxylan esterase [Methylomonas]|uniref:acetylxylan esterase n=1 Tax=Methylomonas TaxID=416 RepID=UPI001232F1EA|nr:acetylxylan esterase [Methylomonas rhizoryzae]
MQHSFNFDPSHGYDLNRLLSVEAPCPPDDFVDFWSRRYCRALQATVDSELVAQGESCGFAMFDIRFRSTDNFVIGGWLLQPVQQAVKQCIVVGHGYGGRDRPDFHFNIPHTAYLFPCFRGLSRSRCDRVAEQPQYHVLHDIDNKDSYIIGGCVDDLWLAVTLMQKRYPEAAESIGYMGISFGGGIGALAAPWDKRIKRLHLNVPTFGNQPLRLNLPCIGSAASVAAYARRNGHFPDALRYYDAATAALFASQPVHVAAALFDPMVAPAGQFAVYNAWAGPKSLFVLKAGHFEYANQPEQERLLLQELREFFAGLSH